MRNTSIGTLRNPQRLQHHGTSFRGLDIKVNRSIPTALMQDNRGQPTLSYNSYFYTKTSGSHQHAIPRAVCPLEVEIEWADRLGDIACVVTDIK
jgi:hypothetical protein